MEISGLNSYDHASLVGKYNALTAKDFIDPKLLDKGYTKEQINALMKQKHKNAEFIVSAGLKITGDLKRFEYPFFGYILPAFQQFQNGVLPFEGSYSDQPAQIIEIFDILEQLKFESEERHRVEAERKMKANGRN